MPITLKAARVNANMSQEIAAKLIGVDRKTLGKYERGESYPDVPVIQKIESVYGIDYRAIIFLPRKTLKG